MLYKSYTSLKVINLGWIKYSVELIEIFPVFDWFWDLVLSKLVAFNSNSHLLSWSFLYASDASQNSYLFKIALSLLKELFVYLDLNVNDFNINASTSINGAFV